MKKIFLIIGVLFLFSCKSRDERQRIAFQNLSKPIIVVSEYKPAKISDVEIEDGSITVRDSKNNVVVFDSRTHIGKSLITTYHKGDTVK